MDDTVEDLRRAFGSVRAIDLSHVIEPDMPTYPTHPKYFMMEWKALGDPAHMNQLILSEHTGTHVDSPAHFMDDPTEPGYLSIHEWEPLHLLGRGVHVQLGPFEPSSYMVTADQVQQWETDHVAIEPDDFVVFDFQWAWRWAPMPQGAAYLEGWPGLHRSTVDYLVERRVRAVGTDCVGLDSGDGGHGELPAHFTLLPKGIAIFENLANLEQVPVEFLFLALPLPIRDGTGSPVRPVALVGAGQSRA